jgi:hypothetical protein
VKFRQPFVIFGAKALRDEPCVKEQLPEPVRKAREMMPNRRRAHSRIDADEEDDDARTYTVFQAKAFPVMIFLRV